MTTDFLVTVRQGIQARHCARTIKYARDLQSKRTIEKFEIERRYWQARDIDWGIVTELDIPTSLARNVEVLHDYRSLADRLTLTDDEICEVAETLTRQMMHTESSLRRVTADCDQRLGLELGSSLAIAYHLLANRQWQIDMDKPLSVSKKLTLVAVTGLNVD
jgi:hypothetical protein